MKELKAWKGEVGKVYTDRNVIDWRTRFAAWKHMLEGLPIKCILEVGCNRGHNLVAITELLGEQSEVVGVEPNQYAREIARASSTKIGVLYGHTFDLPFKDGYFDLVFTCGVLIHIPLDHLEATQREIYRVSKRYILAIEYFAEEETLIPWRGHNHMLWKRDFLKHYRTQFPDLTLVHNGYWEHEDGFDRMHWWLLEKPAEKKER